MKNRSETMKFKRIVFKVGTSSLTNEDGSLSRSKVKAITQQLAMLHEAGHELILVSSGAIAAGFGALGFKKRPTKIADKQASGFCWKNTRPTFSCAKSFLHKSC